jgi:mono/diheme cytochrome c family protein
MSCLVRYDTQGTPLHSSHNQTKAVGVHCVLFSDGSSVCSSPLGSSFSRDRSTNKLLCAAHARAAMAAAAQQQLQQQQQQQQQQRPVGGAGARVTSPPAPVIPGGPQCHGCHGGMIPGQPVVNAMGHKWHKDCFMCCVCSRPLVGVPCFAQGDKAYCDADYKNLFASKCASCHAPIDGQYLEVGDGPTNHQYHPQCFNCGICGISVRGQPFFCKQSTLYCQTHASNAR